MRYAIIAAALVAVALAGCQSVDEAAVSQSEAVCAEGGYGPGTTYHDYCVRSLKPAAARLEQQRRAELIGNGLAQIASGIRPKTPRVTCIEQGPVTRCY